MSFSPASKHWLFTMAATATALGAPTAVLSQETEFEEIVVTGTRKGGQSPTETLSPVDLLGGELLTDQAAFDLTDGLPKMSPSLNTQRFPIADGTAFIRPVTLRNLSPDQTLVLMNGTRRHRSALVNLQLAPLGTVNQGSQGVDFAAFPAAAIERVEILRDGAAAQYGSDAIAGVINIILKDASEGGRSPRSTASTTKATATACRSAGTSACRSAPTGSSIWPAEYSDVRNHLARQSPARRRGGRRHRRQRPRAARRTRPALGRSRRRGAEVLRQRRPRPERHASRLYGFATYMDNTTKSDFFYRGPVLDDPAQQIGSAARTHAADRQRQRRDDGRRRRAARSGAAVAGRRHPRPGPRPDRLPGRRWLEPERLRRCATRSTPSSPAATTPTSARI